MQGTYGTPHKIVVSMRRAIERALRELNPGYFALVMATGIISIAAHLLGFVPLDRVLFLGNLTAYGILWLLTVLRLGCCFPLVVADLANPARGAGFLTTVAATCIVGSQFVIVERNPSASIGLWLLGCGLWVLLTYAFLALAITRDAKRALEEEINGVW